LQQRLDVVQASLKSPACAESGRSVCMQRIRSLTDQLQGERRARETCDKPLSPTPSPLTELPFLVPPLGATTCAKNVRQPHFEENIEHPDWFDHMSCYAPRANTEVWAIRHPDVTRPDAAYPSITFRRGDLVSIAAGGCVQTGGLGLTWKRYVRPMARDRSNDDMYFGSVSIPGVLSSSPLQDVVRQAPIAVTIDPGPGAMLHLQYNDDNYHDNGYWGADDGWWEQCRYMEPAWAVVVIQHDCAPLAAGCSTASPMDVVADRMEGNGLPFNPRWGFQATAGALVPPEQMLNLSRKTETMPEDGADLNIRQPTEKNNAPLKCPQESKTDASVSTMGRIGGHVNWTAATYEGQLTWKDYSGDDGDYNFSLGTDGRAGHTVNNSGALQLEFDSSEVVDRAKSAWWQGLRHAVDAGGSAARNLVNNRRAVVVGLLGLDCAHACGSELHPVYVMAIRLNDDPHDDTWAVFARNWGNEGYCGPDDRPLRMGDPVTGTQLWTVRILLPPPPGLTWQDARRTPDSAVEMSDPGMSFDSLLQPGSGVLVNFHLLSPDKHSLADGVIHLDWR